MGLNKALLAILVLSIIPIIFSWWLIFNYSLEIGVAYTIFGLSIFVIIAAIIVVNHLRND